MQTFTTLISAENLSKNIDNPDWVVIDCRFDLFEPEWGREDYRRGHIPGAVYADLDKDLAATKTANTGRHPLPEVEHFLSTMGSLGVSNQSQVVVYDTSAGSYASRLWWLLRYYGHTSVAVLDGGYSAWVEAGRPTQTGDFQRQSAYFIGRRRSEMVVSSDELLELLSREDYCLIDARSPERFRGEVEPIDPIAGHIPHSINRFHQDNLGQAGRMKDAGILYREFNCLLGDVPSEQTIVYCGSGVTSCHHLLAMEIAGIYDAKLYAGSWSEWIRDPQRPVARN